MKKMFLTCLVVLLPGIAFAGGSSSVNCDMSFTKIQVDGREISKVQFVSSFGVGLRISSNDSLNSQPLDCENVGKMNLTVYTCKLNSTASLVAHLTRSKDNRVETCTLGSITSVSSEKEIAD
jgi:hypothetical protein